MPSASSPRPVSALRARMIEDMTVRGFTEETHSNYIREVRAFAAFIQSDPASKWLDPADSPLVQFPGTGVIWKICPM